MRPDSLVASRLALSSSSCLSRPFRRRAHFQCRSRVQTIPTWPPLASSSSFSFNNSQVRTIRKSAARKKPKEETNSKSSKDESKSEAEDEEQKTLPSPSSASSTTTKEALPKFNLPSEPAALSSYYSNSRQSFHRIQSSGGTLIAIDCEGAPAKPTQIGFSAKTYSAADPSFYKISQANYGIEVKENKPDLFLHGVSHFCESFAQAAEAFKERFEAFQRPLLVVFHGGLGAQDQMILRDHGIDMTGWGHPQESNDVTVVDTGALSLVLSPSNSPLSLERLANELNVQSPATASHYHVAGNDAHYTMQAFEGLMNVSDPDKLTSELMASVGQLGHLREDISSLRMRLDMLGSEQAKARTVFEQTQTLCTKAREDMNALLKQVGKARIELAQIKKSAQAVQKTQVAPPPPPPPPPEEPQKKSKAAKKAEKAAREAEANVEKPEANAEKLQSAEEAEGSETAAQEPEGSAPEASGAASDQQQQSAEKAEQLEDAQHEDHVDAKECVDGTQAESESEKSPPRKKGILQSMLSPSTYRT